MDCHVQPTNLLIHSVWNFRILVWPRFKDHLPRHIMCEEVCHGNKEAVQGGVQAPGP